MAITTLDGWVAAAKQKVELTKIGARTTVASRPFSLFELTGLPGAGVLAGTSTAAGVVPTNATAGCPTINAFGGANTGYLGSIGFTSTVAGMLELHDMLWKGGAYSAAPATVNLSAQPSYSGRVPGGTDYTGTEIWLECVTAQTGILSVNITYTNQAGTPGKTTGVTSVGVAQILGQMIKIPLAAGDTGVQKIESVVSSVSSAGTFNVLVTRPLVRGRVPVANSGDTFDFIKTGAPVVFATSAFILITQPDSTSSGIPSLLFDVVNG